MNKKGTGSFGGCKFKRNKEDPWEDGILLQNNRDIIIDEHGAIIQTALYKPSEISQTQEKLDYINSCVFQRTENGPWERGIGLNHCNLGILDQNGMFVFSVWDFRYSNEFAINVTAFIEKDVI